VTGRRVVPGVWRLGHLVSNAYVLDGGEGLVVIDVGFQGRGPDLRRELDRLARASGRDLAAIAITHAHADHVGSLARLVADERAPVLAGELDAVTIRAGGVPPRSSPTGIVGRLMTLAGDRVTVEPARVDLDVRDGDAVLGAPGLRAIATPGHTPGHLSYLWAEGGGVLFAGDVAVNVLGLRESFVHHDRAEALRSLQRIAALDFEVAVFGHGPPIVGGAAGRLRRLAERLTERLAARDARV